MLFIGDGIHNGEPPTRKVALNQPFNRQTEISLTSPFGIVEIDDRMPGIRQSVLAAVCVAIFWQPLAAAETTSPTLAKQFIQTLGDRAIMLLNDKNLPLAKREAKLRSLLRLNFDFKTIGRFVLGRSWRSATPDQRADYLSLFSEFVLRTYSRRFGGYGQEPFSITSAKRLGRSDAIIVTSIDQTAGPAIRAGWRVRNKGGNKHQIIDVMVEKVSMAATQRAEYDSIVRKRGLDGLIEMLRARVTKFSAKSS